MTWFAKKKHRQAVVLGVIICAIGGPSLYFEGWERSLVIVCTIFVLLFVSLCFAAALGWAEAGEE